MATPIPSNRARFSVEEIVGATEGRAVDLDGDARVDAVSTDSRTTGAEELFVALSGGAHDGHAHVATARDLGALPLVRRDRGIAGPRIEVDDTLVALGALARRYFERETAGRDVPILAIGGAAGKTTTKTLAGAAVAALFGETLVTAGNLNNRIGVPMTLFTLGPRHNAVVLEHGTSERGEIEALARISRPDVGLVVNVGVEHSEGLGTVEEIADEEATLLLAARRFAVTSADEPLLVERIARASATPLLFGSAVEAQLRLVSRTVGGDGRSEIVYRGTGPMLQAGSSGAASEIRLSTVLLGAHAAMNVAAAALAAIALRGRRLDTEELDSMALALAAVEAVPGRLRPRRLGTLLVIDDSYNANPRSVRAALATARELAERRGSRLVLALGDMLELGGLAESEHRAIARDAGSSGAAMVLFAGPEFQRAAAAENDGISSPHRSFASSTEAAAALEGLLQPGDLVLVKGSRGIRMERLIERIERITNAENGS